MDREVPFSRGVACVLSILTLSVAAPLAGEEVCEQFPEHSDAWVLRVPACGPVVDLEDPGDMLRFTVPSAGIVGYNFDNWTGADRAPTLERYDMGEGDWTISTRFNFFLPPGSAYHAGLMFAFGKANERNDVVYWGEYNGSANLRVERTGSAQTAVIPYLGAPVSLQIEKQGNDYFFRHRAVDDDPWTDDAVVTIDSPVPVGRVGLVIKTWGGAAPEVIADFEYFCLDVPDQELPPAETEDPIPVSSALQAFSCTQEGDTLILAWTSCEGATTDVLVSVNGELVETVPPGEMGTELDPPFPGGSILDVEVDNQSGFPPLTCRIAGSLGEDCDEFDEDMSPEWVFRVPSPGPQVSVDTSPGFLRFTTPRQAFDNWTNIDFAPTLERYDMGDGDWAISTRLQWDDLLGPPSGTHHVGLMFAFGTADQQNDVVYWGEYADSLTLGVERVGNNIRPIYPYDGAPVSLRIHKSGDLYTFSHRLFDTDPWIDAVSYNFTSSLPVGRVGLIIKSWGGGAADVTADFDYFCLEIFDRPPQAAIEMNPSGGAAPLTVEFSGSGSTDAGGGTITAWVWDFGDGETAEGEVVSHTYTAGGVYTVSLTVADDEGNTGSATAEIQISDDVSPFSVSRIGDRGVDGLIFVEGTPESPTYTMIAGGASFASRSDHGHFMHQTVSGDFSVSVKVIDAEILNVLSTRCGMMARSDLESDGPNVMMSIDGPNDGYTFQYRTQAGGPTTKANASTDPARGLPAWVRLERQGAMFTGAVSADGTTWEPYFTQELPDLDLPELEVGFAGTAGFDGQQATFRFSDLTGFDGGPPVPQFRRGDGNGDGRFNVADPQFVLNSLFLGGPQPGCLNAADANGDARVNIADAQYALNFLFLGGPALPAPGSAECGPDEDPPGSPGDPGCELYETCN